MKVKKSNKAIAYLRTATSENTHNSLKNQKKGILKWAKLNNINIQKFYSEVGFGYRNEGPVLNSMLKEIDKDTVTPKALIVWSFSRLTRNISTSQRIDAHLMKKGISIISITEPKQDENTEFISKTVIDIINKMQSRMNSKFVQERLNNAAKAGYFTGGKVPFGYSSVPVFIPNTDTVKKVLAINPLEAAVVKEIFKSVVIGSNDKDLAVNKIVKTLNKKNILCRRKPWNNKNVSLILSSPIYHGQRLWGKNRTLNYKNEPPITIKTPAIISKDLFLSVQIELDHQKSNNEGKSNES